MGFKSFKDRTVIHYDGGITGVVGPNGCGKSNIVDALVWVMGEMSAKHLRGSSMEDVIFAGAEGHAPMGMAEVNLILENDGGAFPAKYAKLSEVMVTRRLHRSGESEYLINKEPCRLRDTQEIFMDTGAGSKGFSIIEQGAIGKIITAKPEDRRTLIEEAAGITKFKVRKRESQRKLVQTDQNLVRLQDIIGGQKRQLDSLQRQAKRAERYRALKNEIRQRELWLTSQSYLKLKGELGAAQRDFTEAQDCDTTITTEISAMEAQLAEMRLGVGEKEKVVEGLQSERKEIQDRSQSLENEIRELRFEIEQAHRDKKMTGNILEQYQARAQVLSNDKQTYESKVTELTGAVKALEQRFATCSKEYEKVQARMVCADEQLTVGRREMLIVSQSESHIEARLFALQTQIKEVQTKIAGLSEVMAELKTKQGKFVGHRNQVHSRLEEERQMQLEIMRDVENFQENLDLLRAQVTGKQEEVDHFKDSLNEVSSRLYGLENLHANFEGFEEGVKSVMLWQRQRNQALNNDSVSSGFEFQPVAEVVEVPQEYELAMEAALGTRLQMLVSDSSQATLSAVDFLKEQKSGRSSFVSPDTLPLFQENPESGALQKAEGFQAFLNDVVKVPDQYCQQVAYFLKDVVIVDSIRTALHLHSIYRDKTFVTLEGDLLAAEGVLTAGTSDSAESGVLKRRREMKELSQKREEWAGKLALAQGTLKKLEAKFKTMTKELEQSKNHHNEKEVLIAGLKKDLERAENELQSVEQAFGQQEKAVSREKDYLHQLKAQETERVETITETRKKRMALEEKVEELTQELKVSREGIDSLQEKVTQVKVELAAKCQELEGLQTQLEMISHSLEDVDANLAQMSEESEKSSESLFINNLRVEEQKLELKKVVTQAREKEKQLTLAQNDYEQAAAEERELDEKLSKALHSINENKTRLSETQLKLEQLKMKEQYLVDQVYERYMLNLSKEASKYKDIEGDLEIAEEEVESLKKKINHLGEVNLSAIEEYDELSEHYQFLSKQHEDLTEAKETLRKVIDRINRICSRRFKETFELINERFMKVFPILFGGGEARLIMVEDLEHNEMGIDIVAKPPGKKLQNVSLLSGGEKALTAVSLIFSIFLVKPSPYCLLDEVDAPLDDANVFRFNDLVREMAKRSQIILVTHNKHTMKVADKLYGVTMEEQGVSKMVSVSLKEVEKVAEA